MAVLCFVGVAPSGALPPDAQAYSKGLHVPGQIEDDGPGHPAARAEVSTAKPPAAVLAGEDIQRAIWLFDDMGLYYEELSRLEMNQHARSLWQSLHRNYVDVAERLAVLLVEGRLAVADLDPGVQAVAEGERVLIDETLDGDWQPAKVLEARQAGKDDWDYVSRLGSILMPTLEEARAYPQWTWITEHMRRSRIGEVVESTDRPEIRQTFVRFAFLKDKYLLAALLVETAPTTEVRDLWSQRLTDIAQEVKVFITDRSKALEKSDRVSLAIEWREYAASAHKLGKQWAGTALRPAVPLAQGASELAMQRAVPRPPAAGGPEGSGPSFPERLKEPRAAPPQAVPEDPAPAAEIAEEPAPESAGPTREQSASLAYTMKIAPSEEEQSEAVAADAGETALARDGGEPARDEAAVRPEPPEAPVPPEISQDLERWAAEVAAQQIAARATPDRGLAPLATAAPQEPPIVPRPEAPAATQETVLAATDEAPAQGPSRTPGDAVTEAPASPEKSDAASPGQETEVAGATQEGAEPAAVGAAQPAEPEPPAQTALDGWAKMITQERALLFGAGAITVIVIIVLASTRRRSAKSSKETQQAAEQLASAVERLKLELERAQAAHEKPRDIETLEEVDIRRRSAEAMAPEPVPPPRPGPAPQAAAAAPEKAEAEPLATEAPLTERPAATPEELGAGPAAAATPPPESVTPPRPEPAPEPPPSAPIEAEFEPLGTEAPEPEPALERPPAPPQDAEFVPIADEPLAPEPAPKPAAPEEVDSVIAAAPERLSATAGPAQPEPEPEAPAAAPAEVEAAEAEEPGPHAAVLENLRREIEKAQATGGAPEVPADVGDEVAAERTRNGGAAPAEAKRPRVKLAGLANRVPPPIVPQDLVMALRESNMAEFETLFAELSRLSPDRIRAIVKNELSEDLVFACRALELDKLLFASLLLLVRKHYHREPEIVPDRFTRIMALYDQVDVEASRQMVQRWQADDASRGAAGAGKADGGEPLGFA